MSKKLGDRSVKKEYVANRVKCCGYRIKILKYLQAQHCEAIGDLDKQAFVGRKVKGGYAERGWWEVKKETVNYLSL